MAAEVTENGVETSEEKDDHNKELNVEDKIDQAFSLKEEGNGCFKQKNYREAMKKYHRAMLYVRGLTDQPMPFSLSDRPLVSEELAAKILELELSCYNNLAACHFETGRWPKVVDYCKKVLAHQPENAKALYRRGTAYINLKDLDRAQEDLSKATNLQPNDAKIKRSQVLLVKELKKSTEKEKRTYEAMFSNISI
ncbi:tetratricopeptide repeat protein 9C [Nematostella vectensis]|uniref:tetratricopeptide repeat protein 9C n=1 Tax=Nematostella vectensis TaxID=45351 RepID=UPI002076DC5E|nr:tetratricopeptide repeat protein 9C [Nematostella vectensis]